MNNTERNKKLIKKFETMINTADEKLAEELVSSDAPFYKPALSVFSLFMSILFFEPSDKDKNESLISTVF